MSNNEHIHNDNLVIPLDRHPKLESIDLAVRKIARRLPGYRFSKATRIGHCPFGHSSYWKISFKPIT